MRRPFGARLRVWAAAFAVVTAATGTAAARCADNETTLRLGLPSLESRALLKRAIDSTKERFDRLLQGRYCVALLADDARFTSGLGVPELQRGDVEFALVEMADLARFVPALDVAQLPFAFREPRSMERYLDATRPAVDGALSARSVVALGWLPAPMLQLAARKPLVEPTDLAGMKVRPDPQRGSRLAEARDRLLPLDAVPQDEPDATLAQAITAGRVDAVEADWSGLAPLIRSKTITHVLESNHLAGGYLWLASAPWWRGLPAAERTRIRSVLNGALQQARERTAFAVTNDRNRALTGGADVRMLTDGQRERWLRRLRNLWTDAGGTDGPALKAQLDAANDDF